MTLVYYTTIIPKELGTLDHAGFLVSTVVIAFYLLKGRLQLDRFGARLPVSQLWGSFRVAWHSQCSLC